LVASVVSNWQF